MSLLCLYDLENYDRESERSKDFFFFFDVVKRRFKSLQKSHWRDSFENWKKNKISNKNSNASS